MSLPKAVREAAKRANDILAAGNDPEKLAKLNLVDTAQAIIDTKDDATPGLKDQPQVPAGATATAPEPKPTPPTKVETPPAENKDAAYWEHRFKTVEGIYAAEKRKMKEASEAMAARMAELEKFVKEKNKTERPAPAFDIKAMLNPAELEKYDEDTLSLLGRVAVKAAKDAVAEYKEAVDERLAPVEREISTQKQDLQSQNERRFWAALDAQMPDWQVVNTKTEWLQWLEEVDPFTGETRNTLLQNARNAFDSSRVVAIFKAFKGTETHAQPRSNETRITPEPIASPVLEADERTAFLTGDEIKQFYKDKSLGKYKRRPEEAKEMEKRINAALRAGIM